MSNKFYAKRKKSFLEYIMALEKTKQDKIAEPLNQRKAKRNRRKTECSINRRVGCGICGSLNVAYQGVKFCNVCGIEIETLQENEWYIGDGFRVPCGCLATRAGIKGHTRKCRDLGSIKIGKCLDCSAVMSSFCPNGKHHSCWKSWRGKMFCRNCGYRI